MSLRPGTADQLAAWYVPQPGAEPAAGDILQRLAAQLPHYMLPSAMRALAALPLTVSRKVDYRALPEPLPIEPQTAFRRPCSPLEIRLSALFNRLLGGDVGVDDNFFRLGGNSMMAIRLCHEVNKLPGVKISVLTLNQHPTVAALSEHIAAQRQAPPDELPILPGGLREAPLSLQQSRLWFVQQLSVNATHYLSPVLLRLSPDIDDERFAECLQAIVERHQILRSLIRQNDRGEASQWVSDTALPVPVLALSADEFDAALTQACSQPMDLTRELPLRATRYRYRDAAERETTVCLLVFHHIVFDGWSLEVLLQELDARYRGTWREATEPALQYLDYARWQQAPENVQRRAEELAFWRQALAGCQQLSLPLDFLRPAVFDERGDNSEVPLPAALVKALDALARREG